MSGGLLQKAKIEQAAAKVGLFARQGAGKTTTAILMAIGLSKTYHKGAPIAFMDTENGSDFVIPICDIEGIELRTFKSKAFQDMCTGLREAEQSGCCVYLVDSYTHPWKELTDTFKKKSRRRRLEFVHMDELKTIWAGWTSQMLASRQHVILAGRLGFEWDQEEKEDGTKELIKLGTKMKSETDAGYEPHLLLEMESLQSADVREKKSRSKKGTSVHHIYVLKDRWRDLNGRTFTFPTLNTYKKGDYKKVFEAFLPHWSKLTIGGAHSSVDPARTSADLLPGPAGEAAFVLQQRRQQIAFEEIEGIIKALYPGRDGATEKIKAAISQHLFGTYSKTAIENLPPSELEATARLLKEFQGACEREAPMNPDAAIALLVGLKRELFETDATADADANAAAGVF